MNLDIMKYFSRAVLILLIIPIINCIRGIIAKKLGDDTAEQAGRITLNPVSHLDMLGSLMMMLVGFGWGKPMPINPRRFKNQRKGTIILAASEPLSFFVLAVIACHLSVITSYKIGSVAGISVGIVFSLIAQISTCLGVINLLPIPPMSGFTLLYYFSGNKFQAWYHRNQREIDLTSLVLIFVLFFIDDLTKGKIDPLGVIISFVFRYISMTTFWLEYIL